VRRRVDTEIALNHERWLISYSDFVTLLFALFVMLYSISQVNENKYKELSKAMNNVFNEPKLSLKPIQIGEIERSINVENNTVNDLSPQSPQTSQLNSDGQGAFIQPADLGQLSDQFSDKFSELIDNEIVQVSNNEYWLEISLNNSILFPLGSVKTNDSAQDVLFEIADILKPFNNPIQVEGYTDNLAVNSTQFPSNWELSSARAAAIVKILADGGVAPARLSAVGYGQYHPIAENESPEGREKNRRVVLMMAREKQDRPIVKTAESINDAISLQTIESVQVNPQPGLERTTLEKTNLDNTSRENNSSQNLGFEPFLNTQGGENNTAINDDSIAPVETDNGGLLFSSDPNR
jgi:chemotaxis protein MotB